MLVKLPETGAHPMDGVAKTHHMWGSKRRGHTGRGALFDPSIDWKYIPETGAAGAQSDDYSWVGSMVGDIVGAAADITGSVLEYEKDDAPAPAAPAPAPVVTQVAPPQSRTGWVLPLVGVAAVGGLLWWAFR